MSAERQRAFAARMKAAGMVRRAVWVPAERVAELEAYAAELRGGVAPSTARKRRRVTDPAQLVLDPPAAEPPADHGGAERSAPQVPPADAPQGGLLGR